MRDLRRCDHPQSKADRLRMLAMKGMKRNNILGHGFTLMNTDMIHLCPICTKKGKSSYHRGHRERASRF